MNEQTKRLFLAAVFASLVSGTAKAADEPRKAGWDEKQKECWGGNACKGRGSCGGKGHSCAGYNSCVGEGWISAETKAECDAAIAKVEKLKKKKGKKAAS